MILSTLLMGAIALAQAGAHDPATPDIQPRVRQLVQQLDDAELARRNAAEAALIELGPRVLPFLPAPGDDLSAEVGQRLTRVRGALERQSVASAVAPSTITLKVEGRPLLEVLSAFEAQSGNKLADAREQFNQPSKPEPLTLSIEKTPFWPALDQVLDQAGMTVYPYGGDRAIHIVGRPADQAPRMLRAVYAGPFRIEPREVVAARDLRRASGSALKLNVEIAWEPRLRPITLRQPVSEISAYDERGERLPLASPGASLEVAVQGDISSVDLEIPFQLPPRKTQRIASLRGKLHALLPGATESFRFDKLSEAHDLVQRRAGVSVTLEGVRRNADVWQVAIQVQYENAADALESYRGWVFENPAYLVDSKGKRVQYDIYETTLQTENTVGVAYGFTLEGPPNDMTFVYETPGGLIDTTFDYHIKDVELP